MPDTEFDQVLEVARAVAWAVYQERIQHDPWTDVVHTGFTWERRHYHVLIHPLRTGETGQLHLDVVVSFPFRGDKIKLTVKTLEE